MGASSAGTNPMRSVPVAVFTLGGYMKTLPLALLEFQRECWRTCCCSAGSWPE